MTKRFKYIPWMWTVIAMGVITAVPFGIICSYVFPINDDYSFALHNMGGNPFATTAAIWQYWSGRYFGTFISSANPLAVSESPLALFPWYSLVIVALTYLSVTLATTVALRRRLGLLSAAALGSFLFMLLIGLLPSTSQFFYWFSAYTSFTIPSLLSIVFIALCTSRNRAAVVVAALLALLIPGGNEVTAVLMACTTCYLYVAYRRRRFLLYSVLVILGVLTVMASPGNGIRMTHQLSAHPYLWSAGVSIAQTISWLFLWLPLLLVASAIYVMLWGRKIARSKAFDVSPGLFLVFAFVSIFLAHIPPTFGLSSVMIGRTANCLEVFFIIFYFWWLNIILHRYGHLLRMRASRCAQKAIVAVSLFCFAFVVEASPEGNWTTCLCDIALGKAEHYRATNRQRLTLARNADRENGNSTVILPAYRTVPKTIFVNDMESVAGSEFVTNYRKVFKLRRPVVVEEADYRTIDNFQSLKNRGKTLRE